MVLQMSPCPSLGGGYTAICPWEPGLVPGRHLMWVRWYRFQWRPRAGLHPSTLSHTAGRAPSPARARTSASFQARTPQHGCPSTRAGSWSSRPVPQCFPHPWVASMKAAISPPHWEAAPRPTGHAPPTGLTAAMCQGPTFFSHVRCLWWLTRDHELFHHMEARQAGTSNLLKHTSLPRPPATTHRPLPTRQT